MTKTVLLTVILLLSATWVVAQAYPPSGSQSQTPSGSSANQKIEGCLSGSAGNFTLTDNAGATYLLQGDASELSKYVGQEVRISGAVSGAGSGQSGAGGTSSARGASAAGGQTIKVSKVNKIADTCSRTPSTPSK